MVCTLTYDALNRVTLKDLPGSEPDVAYSYDLTGRPLGAATSAQTVSFAYDALGRLTSQTTPVGTVGYEYDLAGRRKKLTWPDTFYVTYDYDTAGQLATIKESGSTTLATFGYDSLGRRTSLTRGNGVTTSYGYDTASRLTSLVSNLNGTGYDLTLGMSYNNAGQLRSRTSSNDAYAWTGSVNVNRTYTANGLNQLTASGGVSLGYDARGNLTSSGSDSYTYSSENLLLTGPGGASLSYDPLLRLYQASNTAITASRFVYDGTNIIGQADTSNAIGRRYVTVPGSDEIIAEYKVSNGSKNYKVLDERGSVLTATNASGDAGSINSYDEYGIPGAANAMRYQYTGQVWLNEIGLYYYKARLYSPTLGRFMQTDPIGYGDGMNWYNYVGSDPVNGSDPSGMADQRPGVPPGGCNGDEGWMYEGCNIHVYGSSFGGAGFGGTFCNGNCTGSGFRGNTTGPTYDPTWGGIGETAQATTAPGTLLSSITAKVNFCPAGTSANISAKPDYAGVASMYGQTANGRPDQFAGEKTASGEIMDPNAMTAASVRLRSPDGALLRTPLIPLGTVLVVAIADYRFRNIVVAVNDTGPLRPGRILDLSPAAMKALTDKIFNTVSVVAFVCK